jgi:hypothetical protein
MTALVAFDEVPAASEPALLSAPMALLLASLIFPNALLLHR